MRRLIDALPEVPFDLVLGAREDAPAALDRLAARADLVIGLGRLPPVDAERLATACADGVPLSEQVRRHVVEHADGLPFLIQEVLTGLIETGALVPTTWAGRPGPGAGQEILAPSAMETDDPPVRCEVPELVGRVAPLNDSPHPGGGSIQRRALRRRRAQVAGVADPPLQDGPHAAAVTSAAPRRRGIRRSTSPHMPLVETTHQLSVACPGGTGAAYQATRGHPRSSYVGESPLAAAGRLPARLGPSRLQRAKAAFTTRNIGPVQRPGSAPLSLLGPDTAPSPNAGDAVLARVLEIGQHGGLQLSTGRRASLYVGEEVIAVYGARYATDQFLSEVPDDLAPCHLAAAGGIVGRVVAQHRRMDAPTSVEPLGLLVDEHGRVVNLCDHLAVRTSAERPEAGRAYVLLVAGTSMNAGKTTAAAGIIRGLTREGLRVGAAKATGTGAAGDLMQFRDAGAIGAVDFTDAGYATTFKVPVRELAAAFTALTATLEDLGADVVVIEIADGLLQRDTAALLATQEVHSTVDGVFFAAGDAMGALGGVRTLRDMGLPVVAAGGQLTASPLAVAEARAGLSVPVLSLEELCATDAVVQLLGDHRPEVPRVIIGT